MTALSIKQKLVFGFGHILNDLCATMWFTYLLLFFQEVLSFSQPTAGYILLIGQIADGASTTFIGYESDRTIWFCRYTKRKSWHLLGTICVAASFPLLFINCLGCTETASELSKFIYYVPFVIIFQFGWAATQISHLALISDLSVTERDQVFLNSLRYAVTVTSNVCIYLLILAFINPSSSDLSPSELPSIRNLVLTIAGSGLFCSLIFHIFLEEKSTNCRSLNNFEQENVEASSSSNWILWFKNPYFYLNGIFYMSSRLVVNLSQVYLPMYLTYTLNLKFSYTAMVPLASLLSGFIGTIIVTQFNKFLSQQIIYLMGCLVTVSASIWIIYADTTNNFFWGVAVLLGMGGSIMLVMALSMISKLIGDNTSTTGFVYGIMSLLDKISNGVAVAILQNMVPHLNHCKACGLFYRNIISYTIGGIAGVAAIFLILTSIYQRKSSSRVLYEQL